MTLCWNASKNRRPPPTRDIIPTRSNLFGVPYAHLPTLGLLLPGFRPINIFGEKLRLASVRVVEAVTLWREDVKAIRLDLLSNLPPTLADDDHPSLIPGELTSKSREDHGNVGISIFKERESDKGSCPHRRKGHSALEDDQEIAEGEIKFPTYHNTQGSLTDGVMDLDAVHKKLSRQGPNRQKRKAFEGAEGSAKAKGSGGGVGVPYNGKWVVTMMVPGRKLWGSSPAVLSQYKRFRRIRQDPKIARDQVRKFPSKCRARLVVSRFMSPRAYSP